jgi:predicted restriction endonuclease
MKKKKSKLQKKREDDNSSYWKKKCDNQWKLAVRKKWGNCCAVCKATELLDTHHLIDRSNKPSRHDINNGILLCKNHHKFSKELSAHHNPINFAHWLLINHQDIFDYIVNISGQKKEGEITKSYKSIYMELEQYLKENKQ